MKAGARVDNDEYDKESASDFVLWKAWKESDWDNFWEEEFEIDSKKIVLKWRPGWHIECSACNIKHFWPQIDIHMWWVDLIFPHHQNEIAQSEACTRKEFSKYWLHSWHLMVDGKKMSKSLWNFYTLKDLEEKFNKIDESSLYRAIRLSFMNAKYSSQVDFTFDKLEANFNTISGIDEALKLLNREIKKPHPNPLLKGEGTSPIWISRDFRESMQDYMQEYVMHLEDDFNIPDALAVFFGFLKFINTWIREKEFSLEELNSLMDMLKTFNEVFWILDFSILYQEEIIPEKIKSKLEQRNNAKKEKNFKLADKLRDEILNSGYKIIDSREWSYLEKI